MMTVMMMMERVCLPAMKRLMIIDGESNGEQIESEDKRNLKHKSKKVDERI